MRQSAFSRSRTPDADRPHVGARCLTSIEARTGTILHMGFLRRCAAASEPAAKGGDRWIHLPDPPRPEELKREQSGDVPEHGLVRPVWTERDFPVLGWHVPGQSST